MLAADPFIYVWAYRVARERADEFHRLYGPEGAWVRLFRQAPGYLDTHLYRDRNDGDRYVTIDRWDVEPAVGEPVVGEVGLEPTVPVARRGF